MNRSAPTRILVANRGEIAVRVIRACHDVGIAAVAVYTPADRDAPHVRLADEAYRLEGLDSGRSYLDGQDMLRVAARAHADAVYPGYGFLSESAAFAQAVEDAGLVWIGPPASVIRRLADKTEARRLARRAGAPLAAGTIAPVSSAREVAAFARQHGLPAVIKAVHGGGGRGIRIIRQEEEIPELFEAAGRESTAAFGRGESYVERYLERVRHVETQCLADHYGTVVVVSTRDCTLQRRRQKLVEEAPAPFLKAEQEATLREASRALLRLAGYANAGTCEFLIDAEGQICFLEVNTRLQVEHPVSEEVARVDLVREQLRISAGERLDPLDPVCRGHAIEFRINAEDPGRGFRPVNGTLSKWAPPLGPGVRVDAGVTLGSVVHPAFDSLLAKLVVVGADRHQALQRARRALDEFEVAGVATSLPLYSLVVDHPAFAPRGHDTPFSIHTTWVESELDGRVAPQPPTSSTSRGRPEPRPVAVEVDGRRFEVVVPALVEERPEPSRPLRRWESASIRPPAAGADASVLRCPTPGVVVKVVAVNDQLVEAGSTVLLVEAMKMEQPIAAHRSGVVRELAVEVGQSVEREAVLCRIE